MKSQYFDQKVKTKIWPTESCPLKNILFIFRKSFTYGGLSCRQPPMQQERIRILPILLQNTS